MFNLDGLSKRIALQELYITAFCDLKGYFQNYVMMIMHSVSFSSKITQSSEPQTFYCEIQMTRRPTKNNLSN